MPPNVPKLGHERLKFKAQFNDFFQTSILEIIAPRSMASWAS